MNTIKPGYMIQITSWENDADAYRTIVKDGLSVTVAKFFIEFAELFKKSHHSGGLAANAYNSNDVKWPELTAAVRALFVKYPSVADERFELPESVITAVLTKFGIDYEQDN